MGGLQLAPKKYVEAQDSARAVPAAYDLIAKDETSGRVVIGLAKTF